LRVDGKHGAGGAIAVLVASADIMKGIPAADVRPGHVNWNDCNPVGFLHHRVID
jgi:hypothetical protein